MEIKKYVENKNYGVIIYLCLKKGFTFQYDLINTVKSNNWRYYLWELRRKNIIYEYSLNQEEMQYMVHKGKSSMYQVNKAKYYALSPAIQNEIYSDKDLYYYIQERFNCHEQAINQYKKEFERINHIVNNNLHLEPELRNCALFEDTNKHFEKIFENLYEENE